jgi:hypothetical protein
MGPFFALGYTLVGHLLAARIIKAVASCRGYSDKCMSTPGV